MVILDTRQRRALRSQAKSRIMAWVDRLSPSSPDRAAMSRSVDLVLDELPARDAWAEVMTVGLAGTEGLTLSISGPNWRAFPCRDMLAVSTIVPGWSRGWRNIITDDASYDQLTWFLHYARQYVHRSHVAKVLMAAWDRDGLVLHPFGPMGTSQLYGPYLPVGTPKSMLDAAARLVREQLGVPKADVRSRSVWSAANTLDPDLHQAIFHFLRGQSLMHKEFELEAAVALDCALQAITTLLVKAGVATNRTSRQELCTLLGLGRSAAQAAFEANDLRNSVGAHAGGWRWWDSGDVTEELIPVLTRTVRRAIGKAAAMEPGIRQVDPSPRSWSDWLLVHFDMLWNTVWFDRRQRA